MKRSEPGEFRDRPPPFVRWVAAITLGSGVASLLSIAAPTFPGRRPWIVDLFPFEITHVSRSLALLSGFALILASLNLWKRKRRAWQGTVALAAGSVPFHLLKGHDHSVALVSLGLLVFLILSRRHFTVRSGTPGFRAALGRIGVALLTAVAYGVAGFWFLDPRAFGVDFSIGDALRQTLLFLSLGRDPAMAPHTHHAEWFLASLQLVTASLAAYSLVALFRPAVYVFRTAPRERAQATALVARHGRSALDYFKVWPDKSFFFSGDGRGFVAYRVSAGFAVALGDPVAPAETIGEFLREFGEFCAENDWRVGFHQTLPDFLPVYERLGFRKLKVGDDAIVDLASFSLGGRSGRDLRHTVNRIEKTGIRVERFEPPLPHDLVRQLGEVSDEWLRIPGRRERRFTLGQFEAGYVRTTPVLAATDGAGHILGFLNVVPSYAPGESTVDLMRRRTSAPNGIMDYLFIRAMEDARDRGFHRFNFGMAPMAGFQEREDAGPEERAVHFFFQRLNFLFNFRGLRAYKAKFATSWEPRYAIYRNVLDLPRMVIALTRVSEIRD